MLFRSLREEGLGAWTPGSEGGGAGIPQSLADKPWLLLALAMTRLPWGRASICSRGSRGFPSQGRRPRWARCRAGAPLRVGDTPASLQPASAAPRHFPCRLPPLTPARLTQPLPLSLPLPPPFKVSEASSQRLSLNLPFCPLSPPPIIQAASACLWIGNVCPWVSSSQPQFLSLSLLVYVPLMSLFIFPCLSACDCLFVSVSFSLSLSEHLSQSLPISLCFPCLCLPCRKSVTSPVLTSFPKTLPLLSSLRHLAPVLSSNLPSASPPFLLTWKPSLTPTSPFCLPVPSPPSSSLLLPSPTPSHRSAAPFPSSIPGPISLHPPSFSSSFILPLH